MAVKGLAAAIIQFLTQQLEDGDITADSRESLEVAIQCLESTYNVQASDAPPNFNLHKVYLASVESEKASALPEASPKAKADAEKLKNEGNALVKAEKYQEALRCYNEAIELDGRNAVYYCNRAAVHNKTGNHHQAIKDSQTALSIEPLYSRAYGRLGVAYSALDRHQEAKEAYRKALELEPDNEGYKSNLQLTEEKLAQQGVSNMGLGGNTVAFPNMDFSMMLSNPVLMNMARQMLSDPTMQSMMSGFISGNSEQDGRMEALIEAGQQLVQQMQSANPDLIESLRRQMGGNPNDPDPPRPN